MKKAISVFLAVISVVCLFSVAASAAQLTVGLRSVAASADTVDVYISAKDGFLTSCKLFVDYSKDDLEFRSYSLIKNDDLLYAQSSAPGRVTVWFATSKTVNNADFAKLTFRVINKKAATTSLTVSSEYVYAGGDAKCDVASLAAPVFSGVSAELPSVKSLYVSAKNTYAAGEKSGITADDLNVIAVYSTGDTLSADASLVTVSGVFDGNRAGTYSLKCNYLGASASFSVIVYDKKAVSAEITQQPTTTASALGNDYNLSGLRVKVTYADGRSEIVDRTRMSITGFNPWLTGKQTLTCMYAGASVTVDYTVYSKGDVDSNGKVDVSDARLALRAAVNLENWGKDSSSLMYLSADVDGTPGVTVADARLILRVAVNLDKFA